MQCARVMDLFILFSNIKIVFSDQNKSIEHSSKANPIGEGCTENRTDWISKISLITIQFHDCVDLVSKVMVILNYSRAVTPQNPSFLLQIILLRAAFSLGFYSFPCEFLFSSSNFYKAILSSKRIHKL